MIEILRDMGNGLILRRATEADTEALVAFNADVHRDPGREEPEHGVGVWTREMMEGNHPTATAGDFTIVEEPRTGAIVSSLCLISQTWTYEGIPFGLGRPELVGTHPDYRDRGLVRAQFEVIHEWSAARDEWVQAITGIPWFYRQFGYEMALDLGGSRVGYAAHLPRLKEGESEPYAVRPATAADLPFIARVYERAVRRYPIACVREEAIWRYELMGRDRENVNRRELRVIETADGEPVGFLAHPVELWRGALAASFCELDAGASWLAVMPGVARYLDAAGREIAARDGGTCQAFTFNLGAEHPAYHAFAHHLPRVNPPYAWYLRLPDVVGFVRHVAPALEGRLADSIAAGHTGTLKLSFYRSGLRLKLERGRLTAVEPWQPAQSERSSASFPDRTFLQLLFGYRSLAELDHAFADCWADNDEARVLLETMFRRRPSNVWPID